MCLIVHKQAGQDIHEDWLRDFAKKNKDGYGIMYSSEGKLHVHKSLGDADRFVEAFKARKDHELLIHLRMKTHGLIDLDNCHPYEVLTADEGKELGAVWMMHNGVLAHGNQPDTKFSDTWHYVNSWLKPILRKHPDMLLEPAFQGLVENDIGSSNKFTFMSSRGDVVILNKGSGIMWGDSWMSNTYAWDAEKAGLVKKYVYQGYNRGNQGNFGGMYGDDWEWGAGTLTDTTPLATVSPTYPLQSKETAAEKLVENTSEFVLDASEAFTCATDFFHQLTAAGFPWLHTQLGYNVVRDAYMKQPIEMDYISDKIDDGNFTPDDDKLLLEWITELACNDNYPGKPEIKAYIEGATDYVQGRAA